MDLKNSLKSGKFDTDILIEIVVIFILIAIAIAILGPFSAVTGESDNVETFTVSDSSVDQTLTLDWVPINGDVVIQKYDIVNGWTSVSSAYVSVSSDVVTVDSDGL